MQVFFDYVYNFLETYRNRPVFGFTLYGELSHDDVNLVSVADDDLLALLQRLHAHKLLNNTLFMLYSDHGHRSSDVHLLAALSRAIFHVMFNKSIFNIFTFYYLQMLASLIYWSLLFFFIFPNKFNVINGDMWYTYAFFCRFQKIRTTQQGKQEERLPFVSVVVPQRIKDKFPTAYHNLKWVITSQQRTITSSDSLLIREKHFYNYCKYQKRSSMQGPERANRKGAKRKGKQQKT